MKTSTNISPTDWASFIDSHPNGTIFQSPEMFELFEKTKKFDPLQLGCYDDKDVLCGILMGVYIYEKNGLGKILSSRFVVYGGPLLAGNKKEATLDALLKALISETQKKALFIQFRNFFSWEEYLPVMEENGFGLMDRLNYIIGVRGTGYEGRGVINEERRPKNEQRTTSNEHHTISNSPPMIGGGREGADPREAVMQNMSASRRRQIEKAFKNGAEIIEPENLEQVKAFYHILYALYRYKVNKPLPDWSFFENFYNQTFPRTSPPIPRPSPPVPRPPSPEPRTPNPVPRTSIGIIRLIRYQDKIIGGILAPIWQDKVIYEWYVCGLDHKYKSQYPSVLATWAAIDYALENNIKTFDFMGVGTPDKEYGVREFKARFGGEMVNYGRLTRVNNKSLYSIAELGYNVLALLKKI